MKFDEMGREIPDPTPVEVPFGCGRPESLQDMIRRLVRTDVSQAAAAAGAETFDEANDFDVEDEEVEQFPTHHELHEEVVGEVLRVRQERRDARARAAEEGSPGLTDPEEADESPPKKRRQSVKKKAPRPEPEGEEEED